MAAASRVADGEASIPQRHLGSDVLARICSGKTNDRHDNGTVRMQVEEVAKVDNLKYLSSALHYLVLSNRECGREVKKRVQAGWNDWRRMVEVICDWRVPARVKGKVTRWQ